MEIIKENLRGGTRAEVSGLPPCKHCGNAIGNGVAYRWSEDEQGQIIEAWHYLRLYFDEGSAQTVINTLKDMGFCVAPTLPRGTKDVDWLAVAGRNEWTVITQDSRITERPSEMKALKDNNVKCFILPELPRNSWDLVRGFAAMWDKIEIESLYPGPFVWKFHGEGFEVRWKKIYPEDLRYRPVDLSKVPVGHLLNLFADVVKQHDEGWFSLDFVFGLQDHIRREIEARNKGLTCDVELSDSEELLSDSIWEPNTEQVFQMNQSVDLTEWSYFVFLRAFDDGRQFPWLIPSRRIGRYLETEGEQAAENTVRGSDSSDSEGFSRIWIGALAGRRWPSERRHN